MKLYAYLIDLFFLDYYIYWKWYLKLTKSKELLVTRYLCSIMLIQKKSLNIPELTHVHWENNNDVYGLNWN